ncbi:MAG: hypothetical protein V4495_01085 [Pseudomonadota bacterium]
MSSSVDLRGFTYQLDPVQKQAQWKLDILEIDLAKAQHEVQQCEQLIEQLKLREQEQAQLARTSWHSHMNVSVHQSALEFLLTLKAEMLIKQEELIGLQNKCSLIRQECINLQQKMELFDSHRQECLDEYILEQLHQQHAEIDRDWNARSMWRAKKREANV